MDQKNLPLLCVLPHYSANGYPVVHTPLSSAPKQVCASVLIVPRSYWSG